MQRDEGAVGQGAEQPAQVRQRQRNPEPGLGRGERLGPARQVAQQPRGEVPGRVNGGPGIQAKTDNSFGGHLLASYFWVKPEMNGGQSETNDDWDQACLDLHVPLVRDAEDDDDKESSAEYLINRKIQNGNLCIVKLECMKK